MVAFKKHLKGIEILECRGDLDAPSMVSLKNKLRKLMEKNRNKVVLDLGHTRRADLAGLGILIERIREIRGSHGDIKLCNLNSEIRRTFKLVGVSKLIDTYSSQAAAVRGFKIA